MNSSNIADNKISITKTIKLNGTSKSDTMDIGPKIKKW